MTDAVFLENCHRIAVTSTGRDIRFFDIATSGQYSEEFYVYGKYCNAAISKFFLSLLIGKIYLIRAPPNMHSHSHSPINRDFKKI